MLSELALALALLTRLPTGRLMPTTALDPARSVWAFPLAGALVGAAAAAVVAGGRALGMPATLAAVWAVAVAVAVSGGLHEDGLADIADGFGGGATATRKLEIMRDSRIGSYGSLALLLTTLVRVVSLGALADRPGAIVAMGALSRGCLAVPLLLLRPARPGGLGATVAGAGWRRGGALVLAAGLAALLLPPDAAAAAVGASGLAALLVSALAQRQIGGFTGDVLGGCAAVAECAGLSALACT